MRSDNVEYSSLNLGKLSTYSYFEVVDSKRVAINVGAATIVYGQQSCSLYGGETSDVNNDTYDSVKNNVAWAKLELEYLGNGKFSTPIIAEKRTVDEDPAFKGCSEETLEDQQLEDQTT